MAELESGNAISKEQQATMSFLEFINDAYEKHKKLENDCEHDAIRAAAFDWFLRYFY